MQTHVKILGWIHLIFSGLGVVGGLLVWMLFMGGGAAAATDPQIGAGGGAAFMGLGTFILGIIVVLSLPGLLVGWGLIQQRPWARIGGIIMGIIQLFGFPIGTALGIYSLVVLFNQETIDAFEGRRAWVN